MPATVIDDLPGRIHLQVTEMEYGPVRRYGVREVMPSGKFAPIGGTLKSLQGAYERCERLLKGEIKSCFKTNVVQSARFSELLQQSLTRYRNRAIETAQVIEELIAMAKKFQEAAQRGERLGMNADELAFYDALATNEASVRELGDEVLKKIAVELVTSLRKSVTVDWAKRETVRAKLRVMVKTLLRRYKYPPDRQEAATETVLKQAESLSSEWILA